MFKTFKRASILAVALMICAVGADAQTLDGNTVGSMEARRGSQVIEGQIIDVVDATIEREAKAESRLTGGAIGGSIGALIGQGLKNPNWAKTSAVTLIAAGLGEGIARHASSERIPAQQLIVQPRSGAPIAIVQQVNGLVFMPGDQVYVVYGPESTRVIPRRAADSNLGSPSPVVPR